MTKAAIKNKSSFVSNEKFKSSYQNRRLLTLKLISLLKQQCFLSAMNQLLTERTKTIFGS